MKAISSDPSIFLFLVMAKWVRGPLFLGWKATNLTFELQALPLYLVSPRPIPYKSWFCKLSLYCDCPILKHDGANLSGDWNKPLSWWWNFNHLNRLCRAGRIWNWNFDKVLIGGDQSNGSPWKMQHLSLSQIFIPKFVSPLLIIWKCWRTILFILDQSFIFNHFLPSKQTKICLLFSTVWFSVTRWLEYFSLFGHLQQIKWKLAQ